jgi:hypothetical protein
MEMLQKRDERRRVDVQLIVERRDDRGDDCSKTAHDLQYLSVGRGLIAGW